MIVLTYGFKLPQTGDKGNIFFPALEFDIQQVNDHTHNGANSSLLSSKSIIPVSDTILAAGWASLGGGNYHQVVTTPAGVTFDNFGMAFRMTAGPDVGAEIHPSVTKVTATTYDVVVNDPTIELQVSYLS